MKRKIHWGIIGLGNIAHKFAADLLLSRDAKLMAVASRNIEKSKLFGQEYQAERCYDSYEELTNDTTIDIIYIATPHVFHYQHTMMCLKAGKHVLCEKAFGMNAQEVISMIAEAKHRKLFLMEALWTRFIPITEKLLELMNLQTIGEIREVKADFGFVGDKNPERRIYNKKLGGGSLLDVGIYPVYLSILLMGAPLGIKAKARMSPSAVDTHCEMLFEYQDEGRAILESSIDMETPTEAYIFGKEGHIKMHSRFHHSQKLSVFKTNHETEDIHLKYEGYGYFHEIMEVHSCLHQGKLESDKMPHSMSLKLIQTLDSIREKIGLSYP